MEEFKPVEGLKLFASVDDNSVPGLYTVNI